MKKTLITFGACSAVVCGALAFASAVHEQGFNLKSAEKYPVAMAVRPTATAPAAARLAAAASQSYGVSIGTVEAQLYEGSGLNFNGFYDTYLIAKTSDATYFGFNLYYTEYTDDSGNPARFNFAGVTALSSTEEAVTIPDAIAIDRQTYPVCIIQCNSSLEDGFTSNIKTLTIPSSVNTFNGYTYLWSNLESIYMLGDVPYMNMRLGGPKVYVCDKRYYGNYIGSEGFSEVSVQPYGWDFEYVTVNVEKQGEFAETYLTQNNYDWAAAQYLKVTGNINDIDLRAMKNLSCLLKLDLSETTVTSLPEQFMYENRFINEVKLPTTLKTIGVNAFAYCRSLETIDLSGVTEIGSHAFGACSALKSVDLSGVKVLTSSVFSECSSLTDVKLSGAKTIGSCAFEDCIALKNIDLASVENFGARAFFNCQSLETASLISAVVVGYVRDSDGEIRSDGETFENCYSLRDVTFGDNLVFIGRQTFGNTAIENVILPEGLTNLGEWAFSQCEKLTSVVLPKSLTAIGECAFNNCSSLTKVEMPTGLTVIGSSAFNGCASLEEISIPATVREIGRDAFNYTAIKQLKCYAAAPPTADGTFIGEGMDMARTYLYVPPFSKDFYRNTQYWSDFYLMRSIDEQVDYIGVERPLTINLEEEDNYIVANNPEIVLSSYVNYNDWGGYSNYTVGQLTAIGEGTLSAGQLKVEATMTDRNHNEHNFCPTLINYADKMRADNVTLDLSLNYNDGYGYRVMKSTNYGSGLWKFISIPFDVKVSDIEVSDNTYWVIRRYDSAARAAGETAQTWVNLTNDDTLEAGKGYIISASNSESFPRLAFKSGNSLTKNNMFRSTDVIVPLTEYAAEFAHNRSWNLIGNPYPCYFDMHYLNEEFTAPITIWNGDSYVAYSPVDDDLVLAPYEAFFVQCPLDATEMTFKEAGRLHHDQGRPLYQAPATDNSTVSAEERNVFNFIVSSGERSDRARIVLNPAAAMDYEVGRDASKFFSDNSDFAQIYVAADVNYSISERPVADGFATLGVRSRGEETCTLSLSGRFSSEWHVIVTDNVTGVSVDLTQSDYQFTTSKEDAAGRFSVEFRLGNNSGIDSVISDFGAESDVTVTAINGVTVFTGRAADINVPSAGIYVISTGKDSRKAILK